MGWHFLPHGICAYKGKNLKKSPDVYTYIKLTRGAVYESHTILKINDTLFNNSIKFKRKLIKKPPETSLVVQLLRPRTSNAGGCGGQSLPGKLSSLLPTGVEKQQQQESM